VHSWQNLIHPDDASRVAEAFRAHFEARTSLYEAEYRLKASSGDWIWVHARGRVVVRSRSGKPLRMTGTHLDITWRKKAEAEAQEAEDAADQARGDFPEQMSHEIHAPLSAILEHAGTLLTPGLSEPDRLNAARTIKQDGERLLSLIDDMFDAPEPPPAECASNATERRSAD
jgi:signal transduction histidine kinase